MKKLTTGSWFQRIYLAGLILVCFSMPFAVRFNSIALIIAGVAAIAYYVSEGRRSFAFNRRLLILPVYYLFCIIALFVYTDSRSLSFDLEQKIPILALPLIFLVSPGLSREHKQLLQLTFIAAVAIVCIKLIPPGVEIGFRNDYLFEEYPTIRRPYLGMYCVIASYFCIDCLMNSKVNWQKILCVVAFLFFAAFPLLILAKMAAIAWALLLAVSISWYLAERRQYKIVAIAGALVVVVSLYFFFVNEKGKDIRERLLTLTEFDWNNYDPQLVNSVNLRFIKWKCSEHVLFNGNVWLTGVGAGRSQSLLNICYMESVDKDSFLANENYNSHNQFYTTWLNFGLVGFLFLIGQFAYAFIIYAKEKQWIAFIFTVAIFLFCLTESIFEVQKGIILYAFFQSLFFRISSPANNNAS